jgi:hypothetical protein
LLAIVLMRRRRLASGNGRPYSIAPIRQNRILYEPAPIV